MIKPLLTSPGHFRAALVAERTTNRTLDFGSLLHTLILQPQLFAQEYALYPGIADGRLKPYKDFVASNPGRIVIDEPTLSRARKLAEKTLERKVLGRPFGDFVQESMCEASIYFTEPTTGLRLRVRPDALHPEITFDLKSTRHATIPAFVRDGVDMGYDLQAYMYSLGRCLHEGTSEAKPFVFIAAESSEPGSVNVVTAGQSFMSNGAKKFQEAMTVYAACTAAGIWPDASSEGTAEIEHWHSFTPQSGWREELAKVATGPLH